LARLVSFFFAFGRERSDLERAVDGLPRHTEVASGLANAAGGPASVRFWPKLGQNLFTVLAKPVPRGDQLAALDRVDLASVQVLRDLGELAPRIGNPRLEKLDALEKLEKSYSLVMNIQLKTL
jgi:hypothetical protein